MINIIRYFIRKIDAHRLDAYAAQVAFFVLLAAVPLLILMFSLTSFLSISETEFLDELELIFPSLVGGLFEGLVYNVFENGSSFTTLFSIVALLWLASRAVYYIIGGLNSVFEAKETRGFIRLRALSIFYTIAFLIILVAALLLMVFGTFIADITVKQFPALSGMVDVISSMRFVIGLLLLTFFFALVFKVLPNRKTSFSSQLPGAVIAAVGWVLFSFIFSFYVDNFSNYANIYGSLTAIVVFMLWLYICMYILFCGAELNLLVEKVQEK